MQWLVARKIAKGGQEFSRRNGSGAEFADDNAGGGVGEDSGLAQRSSRRNSERQRGQDRIAGAGDVKNLTAG
jgi:hypothetical protein